ncbi:MAG: hypothetical protein ACRCST_17230 [Turicibacter sp.]
MDNIEVQVPNDFHLWSEEKQDTYLCGTERVRRQIECGVYNIELDE